MFFDRRLDAELEGKKKLKAKQPEVILEVEAEDLGGGGEMI